MLSSSSSPHSSFLERALETGVAKRHDEARAIPRACMRKFWQHDKEALKCSIESCDKKFSDPSFASVFKREKARRHHCRMCGRVVCGACSRGRKLLFPFEKKEGRPTMQRVCDACFAKDNLDNLMWQHGPLHSPVPHAELAIISDPISPSSAKKSHAEAEDGAGIVESDTNAQSGSMGRKFDWQESRSQVDEGWRAEESNEAQACDQGTPSCSIPAGASRQTLRGSRQTGAALLNHDLRKRLNAKHASPPPSSPENASSSSSSTEEDRCSQQRTPLVAVAHHAKASSPKPSKEPVSGLCGPDERLAKLESEIAKCEFYEGMVANEPQAMKALLYATLGLVPNPP